MHRSIFITIFAALVLTLSVGAAVTSTTSSSPGKAEAATVGSQKITGVIKGTYHLSFTDYVQTYDAVTTADLVWDENPNFFSSDCHCRPFFPTGTIDWSYRYHVVYNASEECDQTVGGQVAAGSGLVDPTQQMLVLWEDPTDDTQYIFSGHGGMSASDSIYCPNEGTSTANAVNFLAVPGPHEIVTTTPSPILAAARTSSASAPLCQDAAPFKYPRNANRIQGTCYELYIDDGTTLEYVKYEWDLQINPEPIIFIHGFLGSEINGCGEQLWPHVGLIDRPQLLKMALADDGVSPAPGACDATVGDIVKRVVIDIYGSTVDFLNQLEPGNVEFFNWDWRKSPQESLALLDAKIQSVRAAHQNSKVVIMAHSYGGLLARLYMDNAGYRNNVARVVTIGTPAWGSPKAVFPLYGGVEAPGGGGLNLFLNKNDLHEFAKNLAGDYYLYPSASYGPWLATGAYPSAPLDQQGLLDYVTSLGGNAGLLSQALSTHAGVLDSPFVGTTTDPDFEVIVGTGLPTITAIRVLPNGYVQITYGNGDETVPAKSAARGALGSANPNKAHTHYACGVAHVPLPGHSQITDAIKNFLKFGDPIEGLTTPCPFNGFQFRIFRLPAVGASVAGSSSVLSAPAAGTSSAMSLDDAVLNGVVDYLDLPNEKFIIAGGEIPEIALPQGGFLEVTPLSEDAPDGKGKPTLYGPLNGQVTVSVGPGGPVVLVDGQQAPLYGDINCDGQVTGSDALLLSIYVPGAPQTPPAGCPDIGSGSPLFGDLNCDNRVAGGDVLADLQIAAGNTLYLYRRCK